MLLKMLQEAESLKEMSPIDQAIYTKLADKFSENVNYMFLDPQELELHTNIGTKEQWQTLLTMVETQNFIKGQMAFFGQINQRKTYMALVKQALDGNQQAAKQVQEISGIMNKQDSNRVIVLHRVRPENKRR
jgi:hypothetical protein